MRYRATVSPCSCMKVFTASFAELQARARRRWRSTCCWCTRSWRPRAPPSPPSCGRRSCACGRACASWGCGCVAPGRWGGPGVPLVVSSVCMQARCTTGAYLGQELRQLCVYHMTCTVLEPGRILRTGHRGRSATGPRWPSAGRCAPWWAPTPSATAPPRCCSPSTGSSPR